MKKVIASLLVAGAAVSSANAVVLYSTDFNAPLYSNGALEGQDGWINTSSTVNPLMVANTATNGHVPMMNTGQDSRRPFGPAVTEDSVYLCADINFSAVQATGDYFLHLGVDISTSLFYSRIYARSTGSGYQLAMTTSSGTTGLVYGAELAFGTTYTILARYDFVVGALNDTGELFVNPVDPFGVGDTAYVAALTTGTDAASISSVNLRQGATANTQALVIDNISVKLVPTPASLSLLGLGGLVALRRRR